MNEILIILVSLAYLGLLFGVAWWVEHRRSQRKSVVRNGWAYALSLAVYCTAWTYYGSVGRAVTNGMDFVAIYLGPVIMSALFIPILQKVIRICKTQRINSIADFIATRYGKSFTLGIIVTLCCIAGIIPYIALQLKAISSSFHTIANIAPSKQPGIGDDKLYITLVIAFFIAVFGTRSVDATERHEGLVAAVAFESIVKLVAFLVVGIVITFFVFNGYDNVFDAIKEKGLGHFFILEKPDAYSSWLSMLLVSMPAVILLPRQFHLSVVENTSERHLGKAVWLFPLYLLAINIFVLPVAMCGSLMLGTGADADMYVLALPLRLHYKFLSVLVYIGGFSAATGMVIVETIALSIMVSNHLVLPFLLRSKVFDYTEGSVKRRILWSRRIIIATLLLVAYFYNGYIAPYFSLASIGLASMAAVAQFVPSVFGGLYWKGAGKHGATAGIILGFSVWFYTLIIPSGVDAGFISKSLMAHGPWGIAWLRPQALFGLENLDLLTHSLIWSMLFNVGSYVVISIYAKLSAQELYQARIFVDIFDKETYVLTEGQGVYSGSTQYADIRELLGNFLGLGRAEALITAFAQKHGIQLNKTIADLRVVNFSERLLSGIIGSASAKFLIGNIVKDNSEPNIQEVLAIARESQQTMELNKKLKRQQAELSQATEKLTKANEQLRQIDELKDEFLYTVTHELRTPLTSIRALSEIVYDNPGMDEAQRQHYLDGVIKESERLSHLITQVLNLEKYESGRQKLNLVSVDCALLVASVVKAISPVAAEKNVRLVVQCQPTVMVTCDKDLMHQVIYNLLANAIKFSPAGAKVTVALHAAADSYSLSVSDEGPGIPAEVRELIFDKFFQAKNQTVKKPVGTGLGLAISKKIVEMHTGNIWVEPAPSGGSVFIFSAPIHILP
ncbi:MAG: sensor histidine kinase [Edaphocola sp.]